MSEQPPQQPSPQEGMIERWLVAVKNLSLKNVLVIIILVVALLPAYLLYRLSNDPAMMSKFLSYYEEISSDKTPCTLRIASVRGGGEHYAISTGFAFEGSDRWTVGVILDRKPDDNTLESYCNTLELIVDFMRRPDAPSPTFPNSDKPLIWQYPRENNGSQ